MLVLWSLLIKLVNLHKSNFCQQTFRADASVVDGDGDLWRRWRRDAEGEARRQRHRRIRDVDSRVQVQVVDVVKAKKVYKANL